MKKFRDKTLFGLRYAFKNVIFGKLKSIVLLITFVMIFIVTFLIISFKSLSKEFYYHNVYNQYGDFNLVMGIDPDANFRFFSIRNLDNDKINDKIPLFQINTLLTYDKSDYVKVLSGDLADLKKLNDKIKTSELKENEIIINKFIASKYNLKVFDEVSLQFDEKITFKIVEISDNKGLLTNNSVFIDKESNLNYFLKALNINVLNPSILKNLYNLVYLDTFDLSLIDDIKAINDFKSLSLEPTYNQVLLDQKVAIATSSLMVIFSFILIAILFVLESILAILFKKRTQELGIIKSLGASKSFSFLVIIAEVFIYILLGFIIGLLLSTLLINLGLSFIGSDLKFHYSFITILIGFLLVTLISVIVLLFSYYQIKKTSVIALTKDNKLITKSLNFIYLIILIGLLLINIFLNHNLAFKALINVIIIIFIGFIISKLLIQLGKLFKSNTTFKLISFKNINQNKTIRHNLNIVLIAFFAIIFLVITITDLNLSSDHYIKDFKTDFLITNIYDGADHIIEELKTFENVDKVEKGHLFRNANLVGTNWAFDYLFSVEGNNFSDYINLTIDSSTLLKLNSYDTPYIVLSEKFQVIDHYQVGDKISLNINQNYQNEEFEIAGFMKVRSAIYGFTNMSNLEKYQDLAKNTVFINSNQNIQILYQALINKYQSKLYYIVDLDELLFLSFEETFKILDYFTIISLILVACFLITIFNNTSLIFDELKPTYAKMKVLGATNKTLVLMVFLENLFLLIILLISVLLMVFGIIPNIMYTFAYFKVYYPFSLNYYGLLIAIFICFLIYFLSYSYYFYQLTNNKLITVVKINQ